MKKLFKILSFSIALASATTLITPKVASADEVQEKTRSITSKYDYSFTEKKEWKEKNYKERLSSTQIEKDLVDNMNTEALIDSILDYPFLVNMMVYDTEEEGYEAVKSEFETLRIAIEREDFAKKLFKRYFSDKNKEIDKMYLEVLLSQAEIRSKLSKHELDLLDKKNSNDTALVMALTYINTPKGSAVLVDNRSTSYYELTIEQKSAIHAQVMRSYPNATLIAHASQKYNCHSYTWYSTSASNYYWMNDPTKYMQDGSYKPTTGTIRAGDKVYWTNGVHSGIVSYVGGSGIGNIKIKSKWGEWGVYEHYIGDSPYPTSNTSIATYR